MTDRPSDQLVAVVDDDESILRSLEYLFESADCSARLFNSASALLDSDCLTKIDCLISDIDMPGIDGFELLKRIRAARPELPAILITGYPERLNRLPPFAGSRPRIFVKPFKGPDLLAAVSDAIRYRK